MHIILKTALHLFFWFIYSALAAGLSFRITEGPEFLYQYIDVFIINFFWALVAFYTVYLFVYKLFEQKKFGAYFLIVIALSVFLTSFFILLYHLVFPEMYDVTKREYYTSLPGTFILANCGSLFKGFIAWFDANHKKSELEKESLKHELESLKSQVNPHFLFNTLNNIDALIHSDPNKASESLLKLSNILRYMLYATGKKEVSLQQEAHHLLNIVELQRLRWPVENAVDFITEGIEGDVLVAPLLFSPFVENAFKYAIKNSIEKMVQIKLICDKQKIHFNCRNYFNWQEENQTGLTGGIGLKNVKRRLTLLYANRYNLIINDKSGIFEVDLTIHTT